MLETVDLELRSLTKEECKPVYDDLIANLVILQQQARVKGVGLVVLFEGWDGAGKGSRISDLVYNLDARATSVYVTPDIDIEEICHFNEQGQDVTGFYPPMQKLWSALGPRGDMTLYDRGWYTMAVQNIVHLRRIFNNGDSEVFGKIGKKQAEKHREVSVKDYVSSVESFERQLVDDGYVVVKFFLHISERAQKKRLKALLSNPATKWRVSAEKFRNAKDYRSLYPLYDQMIERSDFSFAPWVLINAEDKRRANLDIAVTLVEALELALSRVDDPDVSSAAAKAEANSAGNLDSGNPRSMSAAETEAIRQIAESEAKQSAALAPKDSRYVIAPTVPTLATVEHSLVLPREDYRAALKREQRRFNMLEQEMYQARIPLMIMYEGWDAAGKGGNIKRVAQALDARAYTIYTSLAPTKPELLHPHLWRYWTHLPKAGHVGIYDRSWYGRVLVERVEGFASASVWSRAYDEINEFEHELEKWGALLIKFWVDIDPDEQLARFKAREADPLKQWKITEEDWRNREKYPQYRAAVEDMFRLTSTPYAPWTILESDDKYHARIKALTQINDMLTVRLRNT